MKYFLLLLFAPFFMFSQSTYVPDDNFEAYLESHTASGTLVPIGNPSAMGDGIPNNNSVPTTNINTVTGLNVGSKNINDLTGIEGFTALKYLDCGGNNLTNLNLSSNTALESLNCNVNQLISLDLSSNTALQQLYCNYNLLANLDLSNNSLLNRILVTNNSLTSLIINENAPLQEFSADDNLLTSIDLSSFTEIVQIDLRGNLLTSIDLSNNVLLYNLNLKSNSLTSLDTSNNVDLGVLDLANNSITSIDLNANVKLRNVTLDDNLITSLDFSNNPSLSRLYAGNNQLSVLDLSNNINLVGLDLSNNNLCSLNLKNGNNTLLLDDNSVRIVDLRGNPGLTCVQVDDVAWSTVRWEKIDPQTTFSDTWCVTEPVINFKDNDDNGANDNLTLPFIDSVVSTKAKNYFYFYTEESCELPEPNTEIIKDVSFNGFNFPLGVKYLGNNVLQCWLDLTTIDTVGNFTVTFPESITDNGKTYAFSNIPAPFSVQLTNNPKTQSIDLFAGASLGGDIIVGGAALGPAISAAKISASGTAGMGLKFEHDEAGNEKISRRFEAGVGASVEFPSISVVVGDVQAGVEAGLKMNGVIGQTISFPNTLNTDTSKKAKAAYLLETFAIGGLELSPFAAVFLAALQKSLVLTNPDLDGIYSGLLESNQRGESLEGNMSLGFSYDFDQFNLTMSEAAQNVTMSRSKIDYQDGREAVSFGYAKGYDANILDFKVLGVDVASVFDYKAGSDVSIKAEFDPVGVKTFELSFSNTAVDSDINIIEYSEKRSYDFVVPEQVIEDNYNKDNVIGSISAMLGQGDLYPFNVGVNSFTNTLDEMYKVGTDKLVNYEDHTLMKTKATSLIGIQSEAKIDLGVALGVGFGLSLGMQYSYMDEMEYLKSQHIVAEGKTLPMADYNAVLATDRIFTLQDEVDDLFNGVTLLIEGSLNELVLVLNQAIDDVGNFFADIANGTASLAGNVSTGYKWLIRSSNPTTNRVFNRGASFTPVVRQAYSSRRVLHQSNESRDIANENSASTLYIVSDNYNINLLDVNDVALENFDPVTLTVTIDQDKIDELEFTDTEKALAKMYRYDDVNLLWEELSGDSEADIDIVATQVTKSASYAVGIEFDTAMDVTAPEIKDHYPKQGNIIQPSTQHWAKLYEPVTGVGLDLTQTVIKIDNVEVPFLWNPIEDKVLYTPETPLSEGEHTFEVIVKDLNGNTSSVFSTVTVDYMLSTDIKVFLEGPYNSNTGLMKDDLRTGGLVPTTSPYTDVLIANSTVFNTGGTSTEGLPEDDVVDWVWIELRDKIDQTIVVTSRSALLQRDGNVVDVDGFSPIVIDVDNDDYYVVISHRTHLGVQSVNAINSSTGIVDLSFNSNVLIALGGTNALKDIGNGVFVLFSGDYNGDGQVQNTDKIAVEQQRGLSGYNNADIDMNSEVQNTDLNNLLNPNLGKGEQFTRMMLHAKRKEKTKDN